MGHFGHVVHVGFRVHGHCIIRSWWSTKGRGIRVLGDWFPVHSNCTKDSIGLRIVVDY
nr:hypothetical protein Q903MT_gene219 [Picea sitchensis]